MPNNEMKAGTIQEDAGDDVTAGMHEPDPLGAVTSPQPECVTFK